MKRQFKAAALVSTAALLAIGASFTSMAAAKTKTGTWVLEADGWYCYDKNGNAYTNEWCLSYGKEYFVDENGLLATNSWIEDEDKYYFVGSTGAKTVNDWRYITAPQDGEGEEAWFWFDAKGEMKTGKRVVNGKTYYFDADGRMLTGWVTCDSSGVAEKADAYSDAGLTYCDETGARLTGAWLHEWAPGTDADEQEDNDQYWHYIGANGALTKGKKNDIKGKTYLFDNEGKMLTGWVMAKTGEDNKTTYSSLKDDGDMVFDYGTSFYFCGTADQGYVKKDRWVKTWTPSNFADQDEDVDKFWYLLGKDGKAYVPDTNGKDAWGFVPQKLYDGEAAEVGTSSNAGFGYGSLKKVNSKSYLFDANGRMQSGLIYRAYLASDPNALYADYDGYVWDLYYFGGSSDGAMKKGNVSIADESGLNFKFYFGEKNKSGYREGVAVSGAAGGYLYRWGQLVTHEGQKYAEEWAIVRSEVPGKDIDLVYFIINNNGAIQTSKKAYKDGSDVLFTLKETTNKGTESYKEGTTTKTVDNATLKGSYTTSVYEPDHGKTTK